MVSRFGGMHLTLLIDMDDVLENLVQCWTQALNARYGTSVLEKDITSWDIAAFFPSLTKAQIFDVLYDKMFWHTLCPIQNAPEVIKRLIKDGHKVRVVTASHYGTIEPKIKRFLALYPYLKWEDIIITSDKSVIKGDVMIDDGTHNLENTSCVKLLFDRPHNHTYPAEENGMVRMQTWDEIYHFITQMPGGM